VTWINTESCSCTLSEVEQMPLGSITHVEGYKHKPNLKRVFCFDLCAIFIILYVIILVYFIMMLHIYTHLSKNNFFVNKKVFFIV
jgi:hypothetical protein